MAAGPRPVDGRAALAQDGADGDFELEPPAGHRSGTAASAAAEEPGRPEGAGGDRAVVPDGDFELGRPEGFSAERAAVADGEGAVSAGGEAEPGRPDGDFELRAPQDTGGAGAEGGPAVEGPGSEGNGTGGDFELDPPAEAAAPFADEASAAVTASAPPAAERSRPLHDPDPYSTPPYGEPGPWAPAPPVQHPAARPAQATAIPTPTPPHAIQTPIPPAPEPDSLPDRTQPPGTSPHPPSPAAAVPLTAPEPPSAPDPTQLPAGSSQLPSPAAADPHGAPASTQPSGPPAAGAPALLSTPWQNYDPWAPAPLQQTGAAVEGEGKRRRVRRGLVGGAVVLALVSGGVGGGIGAYLERNGGVGGVELPQAGKEPAGRAPDSVAGIAARALPSVVTLHVTGADESGTGTGFVLDDQGHILTNNHVVEPAAGSAGATGEISVTFNSGDTAKATVVGRDSGYDLAVVKVSNVHGLKPMALGNSDNVQVGDPVVAIGAPFDLEGTVTSGIISAKERPITAGGDSSGGSDVSYVDALQTDAPINPGNSGGPLLDSKARVIGINSAIRSADSTTDESGQAGSIGLGFAIPVNQAKRVAEELINSGRATHPVIGVTLDLDYTGDGARVGTKASGGGPAVTKGGPGDKAGIKAGDIITAVDGERVHSGEELIVKTRAHRPGDLLELTVRRDGKEKKISLVLGSADGD
ncbi:trypsin-like peptidase domain-containing protein [Streptomyces sp. NPDC051172]|uniref:S1C family serine protease n=1 Tax=Streptomyces sp. NPDC051172 TaxID=3155796 RepID=UPI0034363F78